MKRMKWLLLSALALTLLACGGGGGSPGTVGSSPSGPGISVSSIGGPPGVSNSTDVSSASSAATDFQFSFENLYIKNSGSDKSILKVKALDSNNNIVSGVPITVKVDSATFTPTGGKATDDQGNYFGSIEIGQDKSNRTIGVTITMGSVTKTGVVYVIGTVITASLIPANPVPGESATLELSVKDSATNAIPNVPITFSGSFGFTESATTDATGMIRKTILAPSTPGTYQLYAGGLGVVFSRDVQVTAALSVPSAVGPIKVSSLSATPSALSPNMDGSSTNRANLVAKFKNPSGLGIKNIRVQFRITSNPLTGETISVGNGVVFTDENGEATADYIPGNVGSPGNGVQIKACYKMTDFSSLELGGNCNSPVLGLISAYPVIVAYKPVSISISNYNTLETGKLPINYMQKLLIQVTDSQGKGVQDAFVSASIDITHYGKGTFDLNYLNGGIPPPAGQLSEDGLVPVTVRRRIWCTNEDVNRDGLLDNGEDKNHDGVLQPVAAALSFSYLDGNQKTDANGQMAIQVFWGQNYATWLAYTVRATTAVSGSEGTALRRFITSFAESDKDNGTFRTPPFGIAKCDDID